MYLQQEDSDILILDIVMPRSDGFSLLERMQRLPHRPGVIVLTALGRGDFISRAIALGADEYMLKPYDPALLLQRIRSLAAVQMQRPELSRPPTTHENRTASPDNIIRYVSSMLLSAGIPAHICGFQYRLHAVLKRRRPAWNDPSATRSKPCGTAARRKRLSAFSAGRLDG